MSITRKMLQGMDIDKENIDLIIEGHTETVDSLKASRDEYKAKVDELKSQISKYEGLKDTMVDKEDYDSLKSKYDKLKGEFDEYKSGVAEKDMMANKKQAYEKLVKEAGVSEKRIATVVKCADFNNIDLDEEGKIKDAEKLGESIKQEWADFIETKTEKGAKTENPPANNGGKAMTKEQILEIKDTTERQKAMKENAGLFGLE